LAVVERSYAAHNVNAVNASVRALISEKLRFTDLHLIYTAGLFDYLGQRVATKLTRLLFAMLAEGGKLLVANFAPSVRDIAYMEAFMDWKLIYRTPAEVEALAQDIPAHQIGAQTVFWDEHQNVVYLEMTKA